MGMERKLFIGDNVSGAASWFGARKGPGIGQKISRSHSALHTAELTRHALP